MEHHYFDGLATVVALICMGLCWMAWREQRRFATPGVKLFKVSMALGSLAWGASVGTGGFAYTDDNLLLFLPVISLSTMAAVGLLHSIRQYTNQHFATERTETLVGLLVVVVAAAAAINPAWRWVGNLALAPLVLHLAWACVHMHERHKAAGAGYLLIFFGLMSFPVVIGLARIAHVGPEHTRQLLGVPLAMVGFFTFSVGYERLSGLLRSALKESEVARLSLRQQIDTDDVTGLASNHAQLQAIKAAVSSNHPVGLLLINLVEFRLVNASLGPAYGDQVLKAVSEAIQTCTDGCGSLARSFGAEFSLLIHGEHQLHLLEGMGNRIIDRLSYPIKVGTHQVYVTARIGGAEFPRDAQSKADLLRFADMALTESVSQRARLVLFDDVMRRRIEQHHWLDQNLPQALAHGQFALHYQPKVNLLRGQTNSVEALTRWVHPDKGSVPPDQFISRAEHTGLIVELGAWVIKEAAQQARAWFDAGLRVRVAINISVMQLEDSELVERLNRAQTLACGMLDLEITESAFSMRYEARMLDFVSVCRGMGFGVHLDDFGTGYSNMARLGALPLTVMKLDRSFIHQIGKSDTATALLRSMVGIAQQLKLDIVAEGVEDKEQADFLCQLGVQYAQGWLYARAMSADQTMDWLQSQPTPQKPALV